MSDVQPAVVVEGLRIDVRGFGYDIVDEISFVISPGEVLGLVGESGSGKTTAGLAMLGHTRRGAEIVAGSIRVGDVGILKPSAGGRRGGPGRGASGAAAGPPAARKTPRSVGG